MTFHVVMAYPSWQLLRGRIGEGVNAQSIHPAGVREDVWRHRHTERWSATQPSEVVSGSGFGMMMESVECGPWETAEADDEGTTIAH